MLNTESQLTLGFICAVVQGKTDGIGSDLIESSVSIVTNDLPCLTKNSIYAMYKNEDELKVADAFSRGAIAVITTKKIADYPCIIVADTRKAYFTLSAFHKSYHNIFTVGVTGSVGKTTTKDMISLVFSSDRKTIKTIGTGNSPWAVATKMLEADSETRAAVMEMGMSLRNVIRYASEAARPDIAVVTNVGYSHIGNFASRKDLLAAKMEILTGMSDESVFLLNIDDEMLRTVKDIHCRKLTYSIEDNTADFYAADICEGDGKLTFTIVYRGGEEKVELNCFGKHNVQNALVAFACGRMAGIPAQKIIEALSEFRTKGVRQNVYKEKDITVIADCFNSAPDSVKAALSILDSITPENNGRRIAVLADMLELGNMAEELHTLVGEYVSKSKTDILYCYGNNARFIADRCSNSCQTMCFLTRDSLVEALRLNLRADDVIMFKGSHGMRLDEVVKLLFNTTYARKYDDDGRISFEKKSIPLFMREDINSMNYAVAELKNGNRLLTHHSDKDCVPCSLALIISTICAIENGNMDDIVTVNEEALTAQVTAKGNSKINVVSGEEVRMYDLICAACIASGSDGINAAMYHIYGSLEAAVEAVNKKAADIGAEHTTLGNLGGLPNRLNITTADDMIKIVCYAMKNPTFRKIVKTVEFILPPTNKCPEPRKYVNTNRLLRSGRYEYAGSVGVKTGGLGVVGYALASVVEKHGHSLCAVSFKSQEVDGDIKSFSDAKKLFDFAFDNYYVLGKENK